MKKRILSVIMAAGLLATPAATAWAEGTQSVPAITDIAEAIDGAAGTFGMDTGTIADAESDTEGMGAFGAGTESLAVAQPDAGNGGTSTGGTSGADFDALWNDVYSGMQEQKTPAWDTSAESMAGMQSTLDEMYGASGAGQGSELVAAISAATTGGASLTDSIASAFGVTLNQTPLFTAAEMGFDASAKVDFGVLNESYAGMIVGMAQVGDTARQNLSSGATSCMDGFQAAFGNINQMQLESATLPDGFDPDAMLQSAMQGFSSTYEGALGSDAFQTAKSKIGIGNIFQIAEQGVNMDLNSLLEDSSATYNRMQAGAAMTSGNIQKEYEGYAEAAKAIGSAAPSAEDMLNLKTDAITNAWKVIDMSNSMATDEYGNIPDSNNMNSAANRTVNDAFKRTIDKWMKNNQSSLSDKLATYIEQRQTMVDTANKALRSEDPQQLQGMIGETFGSPSEDTENRGTGQEDDRKGPAIPLPGIIAEPPMPTPPPKEANNQEVQNQREAHREEMDNIRSTLNG